MSESIIIAIITGCISAVATIVTVLVTNRKNNIILGVKLENLEERVEEHNNYAKHMPVIDEKVSRLETDVIEIKKYIEMR